MAYRGNAFSEEELRDMILDAVAVLIGDYSAERKKAAILLLKALIPHDLLQAILEDDCVFPADRDDPQVRVWKKTVLARGRCEECGSTDNLEAHHVLRWSEYPRGRVDVKNGQCLCDKCHAHEHRFEKAYAMMTAGRRRKKCHYQ